MEKEKERERVHRGIRDGLIRRRKRKGKKVKEVKSQVVMGAE